MFCKNCGKQIDVDSNFCSGRGLKTNNQQSIKTAIDEVVPMSQTPKKGFWASVVEQANAINSQKVAEKQELRDRVAQMDKEGIAYCPKCYSTSLSAHKKGFGIGKAVIGVAFHPIGLVAGNLGAKKVRVTCLKCGHQFWAGKK